MTANIAELKSIAAKRLSEFLGEYSVMNSRAFKASNKVFAKHYEDKGTTEVYIAHKSDIDAVIKGLTLEDANNQEVRNCIINQCTKSLGKDYGGAATSKMDGEKEIITDVIDEENSIIFEHSDAVNPSRKEFLLDTLHEIQDLSGSRRKAVEVSIDKINEHFAQSVKLGNNNISEVTELARIGKFSISTKGNGKLNIFYKGLLERDLISVHIELYFEHRINMKQEYRVRDEVTGSYRG